MASINFKGKSFVWNYHLTVKYHQLIPCKDKSLTNNLSLYDNLIIHGDNLIALKALIPYYGGKVKCIYIDPPYNTGNKNLVFNDNVNSPMMQEWLDKVVGKENLTRHDKWLCMMTPRLKLLYELLSDDGVIFISIDDNEVHRLRLLMDEIFGEENFVAVLVRKSGIAPRQDAKYIAIQHDYVICYSKNINEVKINRKISETEGFNFEDEYVNERGKFRLNKLDRGSIHYSEELDYPITAPDGSEIWPGGDPEDKRWTWRWSRDKVKWGIENGFIVFKKGRNAQWTVYYKEYELVDNEGNARERTNPFDTFILDAYNEKGNTDINNLFGNRVFEYPKPVDLIKHLLRIASDKTSIILDSFAGSGTTAHAVLELNKEDGGNRKFILIECEDYADSITAERVRRVIKGVPDAKDEKLREGLGGSFSYFELGDPIETEGILEAGK